MTAPPPVAVRAAAERAIGLMPELSEAMVYAVAEQMLDAVIDDELAGDALVVAIDRTRRDRARWQPTKGV